MAKRSCLYCRVMCLQSFTEWWTCNAFTADLCNAGGATQAGSGSASHVSEG